jgi:hypothetical protein
MTAGLRWNPAQELVDGLPRPDSELARLAGGLHDGSLTRPDRDRLETLLEHPDARRAFRKLSNLHANLLCLWHETAQAQGDGGSQEQGGSSAAAGSGRGRPRRNADLSNRFAAAVAVVARGALGWLRRLGRPVPLACLVAGVVLTAGLTAFALVRIDAAARARISAAPTAHSVAFIADVHDVRWGRGPAAADVGDFLASGAQLEIRAGLVELTYLSGAKVVVEGPASFVVTGPASGRLDDGRIVAKTDHPAHSPAATKKSLFTVHTPRGVIDDLGTEFGVEVPREGDESVHVFEGLVDVRTASPGEKSARPASAAMRLSAGQAATVGMAAGVQRLAASSTTGRFTRRLPEARQADAPASRTRIRRVIVVDDAGSDRVEAFVVPTGAAAYHEGAQRGQRDSTDVASVRRTTDGRYQFWEPVRQRAVLAYAPKAEGSFQIQASWGAGFPSHCPDARYLLDADGDPATAADQTPLATVDQRLFADGSGEPPPNRPVWSGFRDLGVHKFGAATRLLLVAGEADAAVTADAVLFVEQSADGTTAGE